MLDRLLDNLFGFDRPETQGEKLFFRLFELMIGYWVISFAWSWAPYIQRITDVVLPLGLANYFDVSFFFDGGRSFMVAGVMTLGIALGFFRVWRWGYFLALFAMHIQYASRYSLGEISHGSNVIGIVLLCMALGAVAWSSRLEQRRFTLGLAIFLLGFGYTSAAFSKLIASGPMWVDGSHLWMWIWERTVDTFSISGAVSINALQQAALDSYPLATLILTFGLVAEFFGFLMWYRKPRYAVMLVIFSMHIGILLSMKISFPANNALLLALGIPWPWVFDRLLTALNPDRRGHVERALARIV